MVPVLQALSSPHMSEPCSAHVSWCKARVSEPGTGAAAGSAPLRAKPRVTLPQGVPNHGGKPKHAAKPGTRLTGVVGPVQRVSRVVRTARRHCLAINASSTHSVLQMQLVVSLLIARERSLSSGTDTRATSMCSPLLRLPQMLCASSLQCRVCCAAAPWHTRASPKMDAPLRLATCSVLENNRQ